ncbi:(2Fe-2S)-binding protein [Pseudenhygromyxa sp. WMMC2535]|uniref:2Fe-2S iron-sulfur cluster-binding protein n=1 Tax=Pseudenhygromyxa sp. WMMC2535 TaxID=2712867 RepID=UPI0015555696|nr:(2Fe-2S)-binding protein [Pseudenhygromyxa sp. WMMC2535]
MTEIRFGRDFGAIEVPRGTTLMAAAARAGAPLGNACRARGVCRACAVLVLAGAELLDEAGALERRFALEAPWRMACQTHVRGAGRVLLWTPHWGGDPDELALAS